MLGEGDDDPQRALEVVDVHVEGGVCLTTEHIVTLNSTIWGTQRKDTSHYFLKVYTRKRKRKPVSSFTFLANIVPFPAL